MQKAIIDANIGISYAQIHNTQQAIQHLQKAIESTELPEESKEKICSNLANVYQNTKQYKEAIKYHQLAIQKAEERNDKRMQSIHLSNLALVYLDQKDIENAIKTQKQSYDISMKLGALDILKDNMTKLAMLHGINNQPDLCRKYCEQGLLLLKNPNLGIE
jgi:tetratricopeptide (TPR) repeat protein